MNNSTSREMWPELRTLFAAAIDLPADEREAFAERSCADDRTLRDELLSWLHSYTASEQFLEDPIVDHSEIFSSPSVEGRQFGSYTIMREIGHGGMGSVFLARRNDGEFDREVAIKIVRQSIADSHTLERFRSERQILASLDHPNIARLFDGGVSDNGEPFLAMEYVEGKTLLEFSAEKKLNVKEKLALFLMIAGALSYAHRNLIVHRDIKPGNILITTNGEPKLLDFGLAKLVSDGISSDQTQTKTQFRALTPAYASPEQLANEPISTASDIYSLGIVLYELLTGERPFQFDGKSIDEIVRTLTNIEPAAPSANTRSTIRDPQLKGDLDNIILKSIRREPARRYESIAAFAADIERYLDGRPVSARPNTYTYRAGKYIRRHSFGVAAGLIILLTLIGGIAVSVYQARAARREKEKAESVNAFLQQMLQYSNPFLSPLKKSGQETTVNEIVDEAARRLDSGEFDGDPELRIELLQTISHLYFSQGKYLPARKYTEDYVNQTQQLYGDNDPRYIAGMAEYAGTLFAKGDINEAEATYRKYIPVLLSEMENGRLSPDLVGDVLNNFAYLRRTQGDSAEAERLFRQTLELWPRLSANGRKNTATTRSTLASTIADQGRFDEAVATAREAVEELKARGETDSPNYGFALNILGGFLTESGGYTEAEQDLSEAAATFSRFLTQDGLWVGDNLRNQAILFEAQGRYAEAIDKANAAARIYEVNFGKHYDQYPTVLIAKGLSLAKSGEPSMAEPILREALQLRVSTLPDGHFWVAAAKGALGECLMIERRYDEALPLLTSAAASLSASQQPNSPRLALANRRLDAARTATGTRS